MYRVLAAFLTASVLALAQVRPLPLPGGGDDRNGRPRNPDPAGSTGGVGLPGRSEKESKKKKKLKEDQQPDFTAEGETLTIDNQKLVIHTNDGRWITFDLVAQTKWTHGDATVEASAVAPHSTVHVEAIQDDAGFLTTFSVDLLKEPPAQPAAASANKTSPQAANSDDVDLTQSKTVLEAPAEAPDRPVLRRGGINSGIRHADDTADASKDDPKSASKQETATAKDQPQEFSITTDEPVLANRSGPGSEYLTLAEQWITRFTERFPNFYCDQITTRYTEQSRSDDWQAQDIVTARVVYVDGAVRYEDITIGGKKTNKDMMHIGGGTTSTGEYGTWLFGLFDPETGTNFKYDHSTQLNGNAIAIFHYTVPLKRSNWTIAIAAQVLRPEYTGELWVDKATGQVWRLDAKAEHVPKDFPWDAIATAVDYDAVLLGTNKYVLPTRSENIGCVHGSPLCSRNLIEFRNYHRYGSESSITFGK